MTATEKPVGFSVFRRGVITPAGETARNQFGRDVFHMRLAGLEAFDLVRVAVETHDIPANLDSARGKWETDIALANNDKFAALGGCRGCAVRERHGDSLPVG